MRTFRRALLAVGAAALLVASGGAWAQAQAQEVRVGYVLAPSSPDGAAAQAWAESVEKATHNAYKFKQFPASELGSERDLVDGLQRGTVEVILVSAGALAHLVPDVGVVEVPFLFRDTAHARAVMDSPFGQELLGQLRVRGLMALAWGEQGFRHLSNSRRAVQNPEDLKGLKIRVTDNPVHVAAFRTLGALPSSMPWPEAMGALRKGTLDGQENPVSVFLSEELWQAQNHLTLTSHVYAPIVLMVSPSFWSGLTDVQKAAFTQGARAGARASRRFVDEAQKTNLADIRAHGVEVVTEVDMAAFRAALAPAYKQYAAKFGQKALDQIGRVR